MRKGTVMLLGVTAFVLGLISTLVLPARLYWERSTRVDELRAPLTALTNDLATAYHVSSGYLSPEFKEVVLGLADLSVKRFSISASNGEVDFALVPSEEPDHSLAGLDLTPLYYESYQFVFPGRRGYRMEFQMRVLDPEFVYIVSRDSLVALGGCFLLLVIAIAVYPRGRAIASRRTPSVYVPSGRLPRWDFPSGFSINRDLSDELLERLDILSETDEPGLDDTEEIRVEAPEHTGLYDPETGLGWADHLENRLDLELKRAASFDQDLSLVILSSSDRKIRSLASRAIVHFGFEDLCYEWASDLMAVILPNHDLDASVTRTREFVSRNRDLAPGIRGGVASRNGRLMPGIRLLKEAERALSKSREKETVVGFRIDPTKYRHFIAGSRS